jgi:hypothetical protein
MPGDHVAFLDLADPGDGAVEGLQRRLARVRQPHLDKGDMRQPHPDRIQQRPVAGDHARLFQPFQSRLGGRFRQPDPPRQLGRADPSLDRQYPQDRAVETVQVGGVCLHRYPLKTPVIWPAILR